MVMIPLKKQSKRQQREYHALKRGLWHGVCPVTRTVESKKVYDRNRRKRGTAKIQESLD